MRPTPLYDRPFTWATNKGDAEARINEYALARYSVIEPGE
jgi:hypothetical protein